MVYFWIASANIASHDPRRLHPPLFRFNLEFWEGLFLFLMASTNVSSHTPIRPHQVWKLEGASVWGRERERERERERVKEWKKIWRKREKEEKKERKETPSEHTRQPDPFRRKQPACALRVQWLVVEFNVHNKWNGRNRNFREREREATSVHYWGGVEWLFTSGSGVWGQCQGLSIIPTIMLPSLTGTFEYDQLQKLEISVVSHTDRSDVESIASSICRVLKWHVHTLKYTQKHIRHSCIHTQMQAHVQPYIHA